MQRRFQPDHDRGTCRRTLIAVRYRRCEKILITDAAQTTEPLDRFGMNLNNGLDAEMKRVFGRRAHANLRSVLR